MWSVSFKDFLKFEGEKERINKMKNIVKEQASLHTYKSFGLKIEEGITNILSSSDRFEVKALPPQMDVGFGADIQVSYKEGDKNYSFFADITMNEKENVQYLTLTGSVTPNIEEAWCYYTEYFNIRFGFKQRHRKYFFYEKPVVVLYIENYVRTTGIAYHHLNNITEIIMSVNMFLVKKGYGARASQMIRPNLRRYYSDYKKHLKNK